MKKSLPLIFILSFLAVDFASFLSFFSNYHALITFTVSLAFIIASLKNIQYGLLAIIAEIFIGGKGYLFSFDIFDFRASIRMIFFFAMVLFFFWRIFTEKKFKENRERRLLFSFLIFSGFLIFGFINGFVNFSFRQIYPDANHWAFFILLPLFYYLGSQDTFKKIIPSLLHSSVIYLGAKTFFTFLLFHFGISRVNDPWYYRWIRDTGMGEITPFGENMHRVFFQSHIFAFVALIFIFYRLWTKQKLGLLESITLAGTLYFSFFSVILGQSRSMWLGFLAAASILFITLWVKKILRWSAFFSTTLLIIIIFFSQLSFIKLISGSNPIPKNRLEFKGSDPARETRINELKPLLENIQVNPLFGSGFGKTLGYESRDPRILDNKPDGYQTTSAFEWGYLNLILKIGILGTLSYLAFLFFATSSTFRIPDTIPYGIGIVFLAFVHIFTPYLDHPLGIGYIILSLLVSKKS